MARDDPLGASLPRSEKFRELIHSSEPLKVTVTPTLSGVSDLIEQLRRTAAALTGLADSLTRLSDGSPDAARTAPDTGQVMDPVCPFITGAVVHDAHVITVETVRPGIFETDKAVFSCPGFPAGPYPDI